MIPSGNYLLLGRTGVGKSSVINAVAQDNIAKTSLGYACTNEIKCSQIDTPCGQYVFYDSPGFCEDDNPLTDKKYFEKLADFLAEYLQDGNEISILLVARLGQTRFRAEDFEVIKYLADILHRFHLPVVFVATWADFQNGSDHVRSQLDLLRVQMLLSLDEALLKMSSGNMCAAGFNGAFAVDNNSSTWLASWKPIAVRLDPQLDSTVGFENLLGHAKKSIFDWIAAAGHDPGEIVQHGVTHLLDNRIYNLTAYPFLAENLLVDLISSGSMQSYLSAKNCFRLGLSGDMCSGVDSCCSYAEELFRIRSTRDASDLLHNLPRKLDQCVDYLWNKKPDHLFNMNWSVCTHISALFAAREIALGLIHIASAGKISILSFDKIFARLSVFCDMFVLLFESMGNVYLSEELIALVRSALVLDEIQWIEIGALREHITRVASLLYVSTLFAEFASYPRCLREYSAHYFSPSIANNAFEWHLRITESSSQNHELVERITYCKDVRGFYDALRLVSSNPWSFSALLKDASLKLNLNNLLAEFSSQNQLVVGQSARFEQDIESEENYWPSWRCEEDPVDVDFVDDYADIDVDYGYKDDSDYIE